MNTLDKRTRTLYFLGGCIPLRLVLVYLAYVAGTSKSNRSAYAAIAIVLGVCFITLWAAKLRQNAPEGGGVTWWNNLRPIHGSMWIIAGSMLLSSSTQRYAWIVLLADVVLGLTAWTKRSL